MRVVSLPFVYRPEPKWLGWRVGGAIFSVPSIALMVGCGS